MAQKTDLELSAQADEIRDETTANANTATRVGTALEDIVDSKMNNVAAYTAPFPQVTASGTDTYTATLSPAITAYVTGQKFQILFTNANTGAATLALNGLAALAITKNGATALAAGDIPAGSIKILAYDGTRLQILGDGGGGTAATTSFTPAGNIAATDVQEAIEELDGEKMDSLITYRTLTAAHTLDATDLASINAGDMLNILMNVASANDLTVPPNSSVAFPVGTVIAIDQIGAGATTIVAGSGVTIRTSDGLVLANQYSGAYVQKVATDEWYAKGKLKL